MIAYLRVSTTEQAQDGNSIQAQERRIRQEADRRGWAITCVLKDEGASGKSLERPALWAALELIADGTEDGLIAAKLDRLTRSVMDFALLLDWFYRARAHLVVLDCEVDTTTPAGEAMAHVMAIFAQFERRMIGQRTRDGLAVLRAQGKPISRPSVADNPELDARIRAHHASGLSYQEIADRLNSDGVPTLRGGLVWRKSALQGVLGGPRVSKRSKVIALPEPHPSRSQRRTLAAEVPRSEVRRSR